MKHRLTQLTLICTMLFAANCLRAQSEHKVICVGFYNLENLFDPEDDPDLNDEEFTPGGSNHYTHEIYAEKLGHLADVIAQVGTDVTPHGLSVLGVSEIEGRSVLEDLIVHPKLMDFNYQIVHKDSRDYRGIDVGLLYRPEHFHVDSFETIPLIIRTEGTDTSFSRDILIVYGKLDGEPMVFSVNHWPSRRGGEKATEPLRVRAAKINKEIIDRNTANGVKTILMGDLNDDPVSTSVKAILRAQPKPDRLREEEMFNPMYAYYKKGIGTTAYQDAWSLFDQIVLSSNLVGDQDGYRFYQAKVFNPSYLTQKLGQYRGYPFRTYAGNTYLGGYSDHFPVYCFLVKRI